METKDHLALGHFLLDCTNHIGLQQHQRVFLLGCIEPDYNLVTYIHGIWQYKNLCGHNAGNSFSHIKNCFEQIQSKGLHTAKDYFVLGTVIHYIADAFTWPHNIFWEKSLIEHAAYEKELHQFFSHELETNGKRVIEKISSLLDTYSDLHNEYGTAFHSPETDCRYIITACKVLLQKSLRYADIPKTKELYQKEGAFYEGAYYHRLV